MFISIKSSANVFSEDNNNQFFSNEENITSEGFLNNKSIFEEESLISNDQPFAMENNNGNHYGFETGNGNPHGSNQPENVPLDKYVVLLAIMMICVAIVRLRNN